MHRFSEARRVLIPVMAFAAFCFANPAGPSFASDFSMQGPREEPRISEKENRLETSSVRLALLGLIGFYQHFISPADGTNRCGFRPSCSRYGQQAIREQGSVMGIMMIGDRQIRCNIFKRPGYKRLPDGKLYDPPSNNLFTEQ